MTETIAVAGLDAPGSITIDRWGIAHIVAQTKRDLFFLQGWNAARDRLWQIDLWRKRGLGLLAADFGPGYLAQDRAARMFLYRGDMRSEWACYGEDAEEICTAFATGINAYVGQTERGEQPLPPEFALFDSRPALWRPEDVVRIRSHALTRNALSEIARANVMTLADAKTDLLRTAIEPFVEPVAAEGVDLSRIPMAALTDFKLATAIVTFEPARLASGLGDERRWTNVTELGEVLRAAQEEGSNNWVLAGSRTATGRPILASDPHRSHALPSLRYLVHLTMPGFDAIGAGEPCVPGISLGHNESLAFGLTIHRVDQEDVYLYETDPADPTRYRTRDGWRPFTEIEERFAVKGEAEQTRLIAFADKAVILWRDPEQNLAIGMRSAWFEPGTAAYMGSLRNMRARSVRDFAEALSSWGAPAVNHVCADTTGDIGWMTAGLVPIRPNWNGLLPVPGDGGYEWRGFLKGADLVHRVNPASGYFASANEMNLPEDWLCENPPVGYEWADDSRALRIHEVLRDAVGHTLEDTCRLQTDTVSLPARRICALLALLSSADPDTQAALDLLLGWGHDLNADSASAALFELWWAVHLKPALLDRLSGNPKLRPLLVPGDMGTLLDALDKPEGWFGDAARDMLLLETLGPAWRDCIKRMGPDLAAWAWGLLHHGHFQNAASGQLPADERAAWSVGPLPLGGNAFSVMNTGYRPSDFRCVTGASIRLAMDVGDWDRSVCINAPGQSGDPASPHYGDLAPLWARGDYVPLLYSREAVAAAAERVIEVVPA
jgi:penicillin G amidase